MQMVGSPGEAPPLLRIALGDMYTGIHGVASVCAALLGRIKSGKGQHIDLALYDCLLSMHDYAVQCYTMSGGTEVPVQTGHDLPHSTLYGVFAAVDGYVVIAAQVDDAWKRFAKLVGEARSRPTCVFTAPLAAMHTGRRSCRSCAPGSRNDRFANAFAALDSIDVPGAKVQRIDEVLADPQVVARGMVIEQEHPVLGKVRLPNLPFRFSDCDGPDDAGAAARPAQPKIASRLGYAESEIDAMERDGVLYAEPAAAVAA